MPELSRSLVDAAADGIARACFPAAHAQGMVNPKAVHKWASAALARGLETLADSEALLEDFGGDWPSALRHLAGEIREGQQ